MSYPVLLLDPKYYYTSTLNKKILGPGQYFDKFNKQIKKILHHDLPAI
jgi:hypothetical protein